MKKRNLLNLTLMAGLSFSPAFGQESTNTSGGEASGSGGTVSCSIGQVTYSYESGTNGNINQGVQQPYEIYSVGTEEIDLGIDLVAFPNPTSDILHIQFENYKDYDAFYQLIDQTGKILKEATIEAISSSLDLSKYDSGVYMLNIVSASKNMKTFKIIKK